MSLDVFARHATGEAYFGYIRSFFPCVIFHREHHVHHVRLFEKEKCKRGETRGKTNEFKPKLACILEASESTRLRVEESLPNRREDHVAGKGDNSLQHYNLVHKFISMPQAMKIPAAKVAVDQEWEKLEKIPAWDLTSQK